METRVPEAWTGTTVWEIVSMTIFSELVAKGVPAAKRSPELNRDTDVMRVEGSPAVEDFCMKDVEAVEGTISVGATSEDAGIAKEGTSEEEVIAESEDEIVRRIDEAPEVEDDAPAIEVDTDAEAVVRD